MNEQLQSALSTLIEKSINGIDASISILNAELPDVISQLLLWYGVKSLIMTVIVLAAIPLYILLEKKAFELFKDDREGQVIVFGLTGCFIRIPIYIIAYYNISLDWLQIWIAPKIWLLEYAANLVK